MVVSAQLFEAYLECSTKCWLRAQRSGDRVLGALRWYAIRARRRVAEGARAAGSDRLRHGQKLRHGAGGEREQDNERDLDHDAAAPAVHSCSSESGISAS